MCRLRMTDLSAARANQGGDVDDGAVVVGKARKLGLMQGTGRNRAGR